MLLCLPTEFPIVSSVNRWSHVKLRIKYLINKNNFQFLYKFNIIGIKGTMDMLQVFGMLYCIYADGGYWFMSKYLVIFKKRTY